MERAIPIETEPLGVLTGRDCVYFDMVQFDDMDSLIFSGDINGRLISKNKNQKDWFPYQLTFKRTIAYFACELDTYENLAGTGHLETSSFDLVENSTWLSSLPIRKDFKKSQYQHYRLFTYDVVYNIIAISYEMSVEE